MNTPSIKEARNRSKKEVEVKYDLYNHNFNFGRNKKFYLKTYGCQMNEHDSEKIRAILFDLGYTEHDVMEESDLILLNTCAIRENVHNKVYGYLGRVKHLLETRPEVIAGITGCMPQEESVVDNILSKYKWLNFVIGTHNIYNLPNVINDAINNNKTCVEVFSKEGDIVENIPIDRDSKYKAWVNIMYGCDKFCTYCIVPYTRGKQRSRKIVDIVKEVQTLKDDGYSEVTLLGQNVNAYGKDLKESVEFSKLLEAVAKTNIPRLRFVTSHPWDFTDEMIDIISKYENIMPYIHLPIQSGSNEILKKMNRKYTKEEYLELFDKIKLKIPNVSITTDIIVGFPGETRSDFEETLQVVNKCKYDIAYTFIYSKREGTPAASMEDDTPIEEKEDRLQELNKLINKYALENNKKYLDKEVTVLFEKVSPKNEKVLSGYTDTMKLVNVKCDRSYLGKIVNVKITEAKSFSLNGVNQNG